MKLVSRIGAVNTVNGKPRRLKKDADDVQWIFIHHFGKNEDSWWKKHGIWSRDAVGIARFFADRYGWSMPYHFVALPASGVIEQAVPLGVASPHAAKYNQTSVGVVAIGEFKNERDQDEKQRSAMVCLVAELSLRYPEARIVPHSDPENNGAPVGATGDPSKDCPGVGWDFSEFIGRVETEKTFINSCRLAAREIRY